MLYKQLGWINIAKHQTKLSLVDTKSYSFGNILGRPGRTKSWKTQNRKDSIWRYYEIGSNRKISPNRTGTQNERLLQTFRYHHNLIAVAKQAVHLIARITECINMHRETAVLLMLDGESGYGWSGLKATIETWRIIFSQHGTYRFVGMSLGLRNAPSTSRRTLNVVLPAAWW